RKNAAGLFSDAAGAAGYERAAPVESKRCRSHDQWVADRIGFPTILPEKSLSLRETAFTELPIPRLGTGFDQAELGVREVHLAADLLCRLLLQVEAHQHLAVALRQALEHPHRDILVLLLHRAPLGRYIGACQVKRGLQPDLGLAYVDRRFDVGRDL